MLDVVLLFGAGFLYTDTCWGWEGGVAVWMQGGVGQSMVAEDFSEDYLLMESKPSTELMNQQLQEFRRNPDFLQDDAAFEYFSVY